MSKKKQEKFISEVTELLGQELKFYLTEFGKEEDLTEIAKKILELCHSKE